MSEQAKITSLDALEAFRARLVIYLSKARPALDETSSEIRKLKYWLENEQMHRWERELKRRHRAVDEAQQALLSARISNLNRDATSSLQMDLTKAKRAYEAVENKMRVLKKWIREFDHLVEPRLRQVEKLNTVLCHDLPKAVFFLGRVVQILADYADRGAALSTPLPYPSLTEPPPASEAALLTEKAPDVESGDESTRENETQTHSSTSKGSKAPEAQDPGPT